MAKYWPNAEVLQASASGCLPLFQTVGERYCVDLWNFITREYLPRDHVDTIVMTSMWRTIGSVDRAVSTAAALRKYADHVVIIGPNPTYDIGFTRVLLLAEQYGQATIARHLQTRPQEVDTRFRSISMPRGVTYLSYYATMCSATCPSFASTGEPAIFDDNHLSEAGAADAVQRWAGSGMLP